MLNEILEIREKLEKLILDFDDKIRNNFIIEAKYNVPLKDEITQLTILEGQINIHKGALKELEEGKTVEEIQTNVDREKRQLVNSVFNQQKKFAAFKNILENLEKYNEGDINQLKETYKNAVLKHHPAITLYQDQEERNTFGIVREVFLQTDLEQLLRALDNFKFHTYEENGLTDEEALKEANIALEEFTREFERVSSFDESFKQLQIEVEDDMLLARNQANLRQRVYKAKKDIATVFAQTAEAFEGKVDFDIVKTE